MAQTPPPGPPGPPRNKSQSVQPAFEQEDYADFEADSTNVNQIPMGPGGLPQGTPRPQAQQHQPQPPMPQQGFASASPSLSYGEPPQQPMYGMPPSQLGQMPGPPMSQV